MKNFTVIIITIISLGCLIFFSTSATADESIVTLDSLIQSQDVVLSEDALAEGTPAELVSQPSAITGKGVLKQKIGLLISQLAQWRLRPIDGLEILPRDLIPRWGLIAGKGPLIVNEEFTNNLNGWTTSNAYAGATSFGSIVPDPVSKDNAFAVAHTGLWDAASQGFIEQSFKVNTPKEMTFSVLYNFVTTKGGVTYFNDNAIISISHEDGTVTYGLFESTNSSTFIPVTGLPSNIINGGRGQNGNQTGWVQRSSDPILFDRGNYKVRIEVNDVYDEYVDSAILVDMVGLE